MYMYTYVCYMYMCMYTYLDIHTLRYDSQHTTTQQFIEARFDILQ